ncbi:hypothetical protein E9993_05920 [Labilibacter sediminis]|nr:hypothetical protein E9993_05920 [Labilibacter sediminis]
MKKLFYVCLLPLLLQTACAQKSVKYDNIPDNLVPYIYAKPSDTEWFTDAKFGVFMHWGSYSLAKVPASWGRHGDRPGAGRQATSGVPAEKYDELYKVFNPVNFDADQWIKMVKDAGAKYFIFTTKHHDGFCMFDAKNTDYKITNTPLGRDVAKELAEACHKYGIKVFWYYSQPDWHHPDCLTENNANYRKYMFEHLEQLLTEYGKIDGLFFDGLGTKYSDWDTPAMLKMIRTLQPGIMVNRRWGGGIPGFPVNGDYDNPEQEFGTFEVERPWEMNCTISEAWSWTGGKRFKSYYTNQRMFIQTMVSGGNMALNTGPSPLGAINPPEVEIYNKMGEWLGQYGESIYNTKGGPYKPSAWGGATCKENTVYLHLLADFSDENSKEIVLPALPGKIKKTTMLTGGKAKISNAGDKMVVTLSGDINKLDNIVKLELDINAEELEPIETMVAEAEIINIKGQASSSPVKAKSPEAVFGTGKQVFAEGKKHKVWWSPANDDKQPWIQADFEKEEEIEYIMLAEQIRNCSIRKFKLEYLSEGKWLTFYQGDEVGMDFCLKVNKVKTKSVRMTALELNQGRTPAIGVFRIFKNI